MPVLLYLALIWRCSAPPFSTDLQARKWALLLGLEDPDVRGARRMTNALDVLEREGLVKLDAPSWRVDDHHPARGVRRRPRLPAAVDGDRAREVQGQR